MLEDVLRAINEVFVDVCLIYRDVPETLKPMGAHNQACNDHGRYHGLM